MTELLGWSALPMVAKVVHAVSILVLSVLGAWSAGALRWRLLGAACAVVLLVSGLLSLGLREMPWHFIAAFVDFAAPAFGTCAGLALGRSLSRPPRVLLGVLAGSAVAFLTPVLGVFVASAFS